MPGRPEAVLFDLDGTLLDHAGAGRRALAAVLPDDGRLDRLAREWAYLEATFFQEYLDGQLTFVQQRVRRVRRFADMANFDASSDEAALAWFAGYLARYEVEWQPYPDVEPVIATLLAAGFKVAIVTNGDAGQQARKALRLGLGELPLVVSSEVGVSKPDPAIFWAACELIGSAPEACVFVGDNADVDARGAERAGLRGVWLDRDRIPMPPPDIARVTTLAEVPSVFERC